MGSLPFPLYQLNNIAGEIVTQIGTEKTNETPSYKLKENPGSNWPDSYWGQHVIIVFFFLKDCSGTN